MQIGPKQMFFYHVNKFTSKILVQKGRRPNADEGWRGGVSQKLTIADEGGEGVYEPPILADVICEQPLIKEYSIKSYPAFE